MRNIILEPGSDPNSRGLFSFINQFLSVHRSCLYDKSVLISFDLICKSSYYDDNIFTTKNAWEYFFEPKIIDNPAISSVIRTVWYNTGNYYGYTFDFSNQNEREIASKIISDNLILKNEISE